MTTNTKCVVCDVAWAMRKSESEFWEYDKHEREQLIATYNSQNNRAFVRAEFPPPQPKKG